MYFPPIVDFVPRKRMQSRKQVAILRRLLENSSECHWCHKPVVKSDGSGSIAANTATLDHVVSRAEGGADTYSNSVLACYRCNQKRSGVTYFWVTHERQKRMAPNRLFGVFIKNGEAT